MGIRQATLFIDKGKFEKGEDSDGDSVYRKIVVAEHKTVGRKRTISLGKTARMASAGDLEILDKEAEDFFSFNDGIKNRKPKALKNGGGPAAVGDRPAEEGGDTLLAILDAAVPPDDSVTGERSTAASKGKSMAAKLNSKGADVRALAPASQE